MQAYDPVSGESLATGDLPSLTDPLWGVAGRAAGSAREAFRRRQKRAGAALGARVSAAWEQLPSFRGDTASSTSDDAADAVMTLDGQLLDLVIGPDPSKRETEDTGAASLKHRLQDAVPAEAPRSVALEGFTRIDRSDLSRRGAPANGIITGISRTTATQQREWYAYAQERRNDPEWSMRARERTCATIGDRPTLAQVSCAAYIGAEVQRWSDTNASWRYVKDWNKAREPRAQLKESNRQGLMCLHNVGAGKTGMFLRAAIKARQVWPEVMVIYTTGESILGAQMNRISEDYKFTGIGSRVEVGPRQVDENFPVGGGDVWKPTRPWVFDDSIHSSFRRFEDGTPSVLAVSIDQLVRAVVDVADQGKIKKHWSEVRVQGSARGRQRNVRKLPDRPILLFIDEAHLLTDPSPTKAKDYDFLYKYLLMDQSTGKHNKIYNVLLTSTPGRTSRDLAKLSKLVTTRAGRAVCEQLEKDPEPSIELIDDYARAMRGCVDVWMMLGEKVYPTVVDRSDMSGFSKIKLAPVRSAEDAHVYASRTCMAVPRKRGRASTDLMELYQKFLEPAERKRLGDNLGQVINTLISEIRSGNRLENMKRRIHLVTVARLHALIYDPRTIESIHKASLRCKTRNDFPGSTFKFLDDQVREWARNSRRWFERELEKNPEALQPPARTPQGDDVELTVYAPKLALLAWRVLRPRETNDGAIGNTFVPKMQQIIAIPLTREEATQMRLDSLIKIVLEEVCRLHPTAGREWPKYLDPADAGDMEKLVGKAGTSQFAKDYTSIREKKKEVHAVVLLPSSEYGISLSIRNVERIHLVEWGDDASMSQAIGRAQRPCARSSSATPPEVMVYRYVMCTDRTGRRDDTGVLERSVARHLRVLEREAAERGVNLGTKLAIALSKFEDAARTHLRHREVLDELKTAADEADARYKSDPRAPASSIDAILGMALMDAMDLRRIGDKLLSATVRNDLDVMKGRLLYASRLVDTGRLGYDDEKNKVAEVYGEAFRGEPSLLIRHAGSIIVKAGRALDEEIKLSSAADNAYMALSTIARYARNARVGRSGDGVSIDEALIRAYANASQTMNSMIAALFRSSVSCDVYREMHLKYGQLPGIPDDCNLAREVMCGRGATGRCDRAQGISTQFRQTARDAAAEMERYKNPTDDDGRDGDDDVQVAAMMKHVVSSAHTMCREQKQTIKQCEQVDAAKKRVVRPGHPLYKTCMQLATCTDVNRLYDALNNGADIKRISTGAKGEQNQFAEWGWGDTGREALGSAARRIGDVRNFFAPGPREYSF